MPCEHHFELPWNPRMNSGFLAVIIMAIVVLLLHSYISMDYHIQQEVSYTGGIDAMKKQTANQVRSDKEDSTPVSSRYWLQRARKEGWPKMFTKALGRIGNCLFAISSVYALAGRSHHLPVLADGFSYLNKSFPNLHMDFEELPLENNTAVIGEIGFATYSIGHFLAVPKTDVILSGYYQSYKYFRHITKYIRELFAFSDDLNQKAETDLLRIKRMYSTRSDSVNNLTFVGLHVRHGMAYPSKVALGYKAADLSYVYKAMHYFNVRYKTVAFVVRSDNLSWCVENIFGSNVFHLPEGSPEEDLALLSHCNHTIMTVGTYGWWAGWLADGEVAYYHEPYDMSKSLSQGFTREDHFPPSWIPISNMTRADVEKLALRD